MSRARFSTSASLSPRLKELRTNLRVSCADAVAFGGMVGFGETYLVAFALAIGLSELTAGFMGSLPLVVGGLVQLASPRMIAALGSHKRWVVVCSTIQALAFVPLVFTALRGSISGIGLLAIASIYWGAGLATGPAWNTWIGTVVPRPIRPRYFAFRTRGSQVTVFLGFLAGGLLLQYATKSDRLMAAYAVLFGIACLCRLYSAWMLALQSEPTPIPKNMETIPLLKSFRHLQSQSSGKLIWYLVAVQASAQIAGPYFTPYMFQKLHFSYGQFVTLISASFLAKVLSLPLWGHLAHRIGPRNLLWVGGIGIAPMGGVWMFSDSMPWLIAVQVAAGVVWAAYELAFFLLFFDSIDVEQRTSLLTLYNLINSVAFVCGAILGGVVLSMMGFSNTAYLAIFGISSVGRTFALLLLARIPEIKTFDDDIELRPLSVRPNGASFDAPIIAGLNDELVHVDAMQSSSLAPQR